VPGKTRPSPAAPVGGWRDSCRCPAAAGSARCSPRWQTAAGPPAVELPPARAGHRFGRAPGRGRGAGDVAIAPATLAVGPSLPPELKESGNNLPPVAAAASKLLKRNAASECYRWLESVGQEPLAVGSSALPGRWPRLPAAARARLKCPPVVPPCQPEHYRYRVLVGPHSPPAHSPNGAVP
jgi:hypothetical protein